MDLVQWVPPTSEVLRALEQPLVWRPDLEMAPYWSRQAAAVLWQQSVTALVASTVFSKGSLGGSGLHITVLCWMDCQGM